ncbi:DNA polymerase III alpha subunit [Veillonella parvula HSIVP1]|nr:hypothetical protein [Veillonella parvula]EQC65637.1 DNA polymerase III alpha subunit [Veillonella parvula HSIVP1]
MKVRYRVVPKRNKKSSFYVNCHSQHVTIQAADSAFSTLLSLRERLSAWYKEKISLLMIFQQIQIQLVALLGK